MYNPAKGVAWWGGGAARSVGGRGQLQVGAGAGAHWLAGRWGGAVPRVDADGRRRAADAEVADDQDVAVLVGPAEVETASTLGGPEGDRVLEEPEPVLRVTAVVIAVHAEVHDVAGRRATRRTCAGRGQAVSGCEAVQQNVLARQATGPLLPEPARRVEGILGGATSEGGASLGPLGNPFQRDRGGVGAGRCGTLDGPCRRLVEVDLLADPIPVVGSRRLNGIVGDGVAIELERPRVVYGRCRDSGQRCQWQHKRCHSGKSLYTYPHKHSPGNIADCFFSNVSKPARGAPATQGWRGASDQSLACCQSYSSCSVAMVDLPV